MKQMANKMGQCANCLGQGKDQQAMAGLEAMQNELQTMQRQLEQMEMLDQALDAIAMSKLDFLNDQFAMGQGMGRGKGKGKGDGLGAGQGEGFRPENKSDGSKFVNSNVRGRNQPRGAGVIVGEDIFGPNAKGEARKFIQGAIEAARAEDTDPLTGRRLPKAYREQVRDYFNKFRKGETGE